MASPARPGAGAAAAGARVSGPKDAAVRPASAAAAPLLRATALARDLSGTIRTAHCAVVDAARGG